MATTINGSTGASQIQDDIVSLAKMAPGTDGNIISYDASGNPVAVATGSDGQVLTSTGAGSPPAFETLAASGGLTLLSTLNTTSGTSVTTDTLNLSTYKILFLACNGVGFAADTGGLFQLTPNGGTLCGFNSGWGNAAVMYSVHTIDLSSGVGSGVANIAGGARAIADGEGQGRTFRNSGLTTSTTSIMFNSAGGATFDEGNIKIYGLK